MDLEFEAETFITQTQVMPGSPQVHHVLMYALAPAMAQAVHDANGEDGTIGHFALRSVSPAVVVTTMGSQHNCYVPVN